MQPIVLLNQSEKGRGGGSRHDCVSKGNSVLYIDLKQRGNGLLFSTKDEDVASSFAVEVKHSRDDTEYKSSQNASGEAATPLLIFVIQDDRTRTWRAQSLALKI